MAKITHEQYADIVNRIDTLGEKVSEVAVAFSCTPATIYNILGKIRKSMKTEVEVKTTIMVDSEVRDAPHEPWTSAMSEVIPLEPVLVKVEEVVAPVVALVSQKPEDLEVGPTKKVVTPDVTPQTEDDFVSPRGLSKGNRDKSAKPGVGLFIKTPDDENMVPFRTLEDALTSVKHILKTAFKQPDTVWFSLQSIDLATVDMD